jgi:hypothetical protein
MTTAPLDFIGRRSGAPFGNVHTRVSSRIGNPQVRHELERCVEQLGFKGALVNGCSNIHDVNTIEYSDEPKFEECIGV